MSAVVAVYRQLLKQSKTTFQGDAQATAAAWHEIRNNFRLNAAAQTSDVPRLVDDGREAAEFLEKSVVQGQLNERGNYAVTGLPDQEVVNILDPTQVKLKQPRMETKS